MLSICIIMNWKLHGQPNMKRKRGAKKEEKKKEEEEEVNYFSVEQKIVEDEFEFPDFDRELESGVLSNLDHPFYIFMGAQRKYIDWRSYSHRNLQPPKYSSKKERN